MHHTYHARYGSLTILVLGLTLMFSNFLHAQETPPEEPPLPPLPGIPVTEELGNVSCFDYYTFGSVQVVVSPYFPSVNTTDPVTFAGTIINDNPYPIVDGQVWMKVFRRADQTDSETKENGYPLVDFVLIEDHIVLGAKESLPTEFTWTVPQYAQSGAYTAAFFFTTAHRYNLLGLSFTDDVTGNTTDFTVTNPTDFIPVSFDKHSVRLNNTDVSFALPPRHFLPQEEVFAYATLVNDASETRAVTLTWTTYQWDGILEVFKRDTHTETTTIDPKSTKEVSYPVPTLTTAVTYVLAEVKDGDSTSLLNIRFVRDDIPETRINFPSVTTYPLKAGEEMSLFSCVHATNFPLVPDNTLTLTLKDKTGAVLHTYTYTGGITGAMMGIADTYTPDRTLGTFSLTASLSRGGVPVEEITTTYRCEDLDPTLCTTDDTTLGVDDTTLTRIALGTILAFVLFIILLLSYKKRANPPVTPDVHIP